MCNNFKIKKVVKKGRVFLIKKMMGSWDMKIWKTAPYKYKKTTRVKMSDFHHICLSCTARVMNGQTSGAAINFPILLF